VVFAAAYGAPTRVQALGWPAIRAIGGVLLVAPTGSGKTLAAFLVAIDRLMFDRRRNSCPPGHCR
jgi:ATP-dependent Lhr-like helicase